jgi:peroxiredoxin
MLLNDLRNYLIPEKNFALCMHANGHNGHVNTVHSSSGRENDTTGSRKPTAMASEPEMCALPRRRPAVSGRAAVPGWIVWSLRGAAIYNVAFGLFAVAFPLSIWPWLGMEPPRYPELWQCIGMIVGVYGVGYWIAAADPVRHWPVIFVGWLGKVLGPIGFVSAALRGDLPWAFGWVNLLNDWIWWIPFMAALYYAWRAHAETGAESNPLSFREAVHELRSQRGRTLAELSANQAVLVLFIRHAGCTFCRQALTDVAEIREQMQHRGVRLAVVHMSAVSTADALLAGYGLAEIDHYSDPERRMYRAFELTRAAWWQLFGPRVWVRGLTSILRHGQGAIDGDGFQLPGVFLIRDARIVAAYRHLTAADRPNYLRLIEAA